MELSEFAYLKDLEDMDPFNIIGVDGGKQIEQVIGQIEGPYRVENPQRTRGRIQRNDQYHSQVSVSEAPNNMKEE